MKKEEEIEEDMDQPREKRVVVEERLVPTSDVAS